MYPNPATTTLSLQRDAAYEGDVAIIRNTLGQILITQNIGSNRQPTLSLSSLAAGRYWLSIQSRGQVVCTQAFVKQ